MKNTYSIVFMFILGIMIYAKEYCGKMIFTLDHQATIVDITDANIVYYDNRGYYYYNHITKAVNAEYFLLNADGIAYAIYSNESHVLLVLIKSELMQGFTHSGGEVIIYKKGIEKKRTMYLGDGPRSRDNYQIILLDHNLKPNEEHIKLNDIIPNRDIIKNSKTAIIRTEDRFYLIDSAGNIKIIPTYSGYKYYDIGNDEDIILYCQKCQSNNMITYHDSEWLNLGKAYYRNKYSGTSYFIGENNDLKEMLNGGEKTLFSSICDNEDNIQLLYCDSDTAVIKSLKNNGEIAVYDLKQGVCKNKYAEYTYTCESPNDVYTAGATIIIDNLNEIILYNRTANTFKRIKKPRIKKDDYSLNISYLPFKGDILYCHGLKIIRFTENGRIKKYNIKDLDIKQHLRKAATIPTYRFLVYNNTLFWEMRSVYSTYVYQFELK